MDGASARYEWLLLQVGALPLRPDGSHAAGQPHRCTSVMLWPAGQNAFPGNTLITDPCFLGDGAQQIMHRLLTMRYDLPDLGTLFVTHPHHDHQPSLQYRLPLSGVRFAPGAESFPAVRTVPLPGHDAAQKALVFTDQAEQAVWIVGDAVLDEAWLRAWRYYWPNSYLRGEIVQTWHSVATVLAEADVIVPGHGPPIPVTADLLRDLVAGFPQAEHADLCPAVGDMLQARLDTLRQA